MSRPHARRLATTTVVLLAFASAGPPAAHAHGGGLDANGCHTNRKTGEYHCHRAPAAAPSRPQTLHGQRPSSDDDVRYANCSEARAAGAAPVRRGDPGYGRHLDRDNDGVGCE